MSEIPEIEETIPHEASGWLKLVLRLVITAALFYLIFRSVEFGSVLAVMKQLNPVWLLPALVMQLLSTLTASYRWYLIMHLLGFGQTLFYYIGSYFKGMLFNQALPTSIGGDAIRILDTGKLGKGHKEAFYGVFIDRMVGLAGLLLLNLLAILAGSLSLPKGIHILIGLMSAAGIVGVFVLMGLKKLDWLTRFKPTRMFHHISKRMEVIYHSANSALTQTALSLAIHLFAMAAVFSVGRSVGMTEDFSVFLVLVPPALLLTIVPVSLAGWGVRESALIGLFLLIGADKTVVLSMSLLYGVLLIAASLPGLYFYLKGHRHQPDTNGDTP